MLRRSSCFASASLVLHGCKSARVVSSSTTLYDVRGNKYLCTLHVCSHVPYGRRVFSSLVVCAIGAMCAVMRVWGWGQPSSSAPPPVHRTLVFSPRRMCVVISLAAVVCYKVVRRPSAARTPYVIAHRARTLLQAQRSNRRQPRGGPFSASLRALMGEGVSLY